MKSAADVIAALDQTPSRLDKEKLVLAAWDYGIVEFFEGAIMAYDAMKTYGVKKVPLIDEQDDPNFRSSFEWDSFKDLAQKLGNRELTGNAARQALVDAANKSSVVNWNGFYRRVLLKDLKCGTTDSTINKVLEKIGGDALKYIIPVFSCQLAKNGEDHPKKMTGLKLLDVKLDGVRILSILDKDKNTVTQYSRDGRINENFPQIVNHLSKLLPIINTSMVFDGEMVSRNFQALMKQLNRKGDVDTSDAKLALFDCIPLVDFMSGEYNVSQSNRHAALSEFQPMFDKIANGSIYVVPKLLVNLDTPDGQTTFKEFNRDAIEAGYEGIMIKDPWAKYKNKRSDAWLKIKPWITVDLEIVGVEPGKPESKFANTLGGLVCRGIDQGKSIEVTVGGGYSEELRDELWKYRDTIIGRIVEIKGDALTKSQNNDTWSLRFPVFEQFRGWVPGEKI